MTKAREWARGFKTDCALAYFRLVDIILSLFFPFYRFVASLGLLIYKKKTLKSRIPFAPFIILGSLVLIFWSGYFSGLF